MKGTTVVLFLIVWLAGTFMSLVVCSYLKGRSEVRFRDNPGLTDDPPFLVGMLTSPFWPVQIAGGLVWFLCHMAQGAGSGDGLTVNAELKHLRRFASEYNTEYARTMQFLTSQNVSPEAVDDNTRRALTARSIEWAMSDDAYLRRGEMPPPVEAQDQMFDVLDRAGVLIKTPEYDEYRTRHPKELEL